MSSFSILANIGLYTPVALFLLIQVLQQFTHTMWWFTHVWDPMGNFLVGFVFYGLPFVALLFVYSTPHTGLFSRILKILVGIGFALFIALHLFLVIRFGTLFPSDIGAGIVSFSFFIFAGPIFLLGSLWMSFVNFAQLKSNKLKPRADGRD